MNCKWTILRKGCWLDKYAGKTFSKFVNRAFLLNKF